MVSDRSMSWAMFFFVGLFAVVFVMGITGCSASGDKPNVEIIQDMMEQPAIKAQDFNPHNRSQTGQRLPPEGTAAMNREVYLYKGNPDGASKNLKNPSPFGAGTDAAATLTLGEKHYKNYCLVCHGEQGKGDGPVAAKFQGIQPPSLLSDKVRNERRHDLSHRDRRPGCRRGTSIKCHGAKIAGRSSLTFANCKTTIRSSGEKNVWFKNG